MKTIRIISFLMVLILSVGLIGSCSEEEAVEQKQSPRTYEEYMEASELRYPFTDSKLRYTLYDTCATVTECLTKDSEITIPSTVLGVPVIAIEKDAFSGNDTLESLVMGTNILMIGEGAFRDCSALSAVRMSGSVIDIGNRAFANCVSLKSIIIPSKVYTIPQEAFSGCKKLVKVMIEELNEGVKQYMELKLASNPENIGRSIAGNAFSGCDSLAAIWIPADMVRIDTTAFSSRTSVIFGEEKTMAAAYAAGKRMDYGVTTKTEFSTAIRTYTPVDEETEMTAPGTEIKTGSFVITFDSIEYKNTYKNIKTDINEKIAVLAFTVKNTSVYNSYFDGLGIQCRSWARDTDGIMRGHKKNILYNEDALLCGEIGAGKSLTGEIAVKVNQKSAYISVEIPETEVFFVKRSEENYDQKFIKR